MSPAIPNLRSTRLGANTSTYHQTPRRRSASTSSVTHAGSTPESTPIWSPANRSSHANMSGLPKRIIKESERLVKEPVQGISATPHDDNLRYFDVTIDGPSQSPYEGESALNRGAGDHHEADMIRRRLQARAVPSRRLPHDPAQGALPHQDLPPQHRQTGPHLPRRPQE
jgi:hypothetical protein